MSRRAAGRCLRGRAGAGADELEVWCRFHKEVERLPLDERELVSLVYYHGWTHQQVAELFGVAERTIRRRWASACTRLRAAVGEEKFLELLKETFDARERESE